MRTDRAGSQASRGTQGGKSYPRDNSQVMPVVIEIILPLELFNHWQSHMQGGDKIEERTSLITSATLNCLPSPNCCASHQHLRFLQPHLSVSVPPLVSRFCWDEALMDKPYQLFPDSLIPPMDGLLVVRPNFSFLLLWLNSKWDTSVVPFRVDHQMDKAQSH